MRLPLMIYMSKMKRVYNRCCKGEYNGKYDGYVAVNKYR